MNKKIFFTLLIFVLAFVISGCSITFQGAGGGNDGGVYVSSNQGNNWQQRTLVPTVSGSAQNFGFLNAATLAMDPSDNKALYFGSIDNGMYYTYDQTATWQKVDELGQTTIRSIAVDAKDKCTIYVAIDNKVWKSDDCNRSWDQVYYDTDPKTVINTVVVDHYNNNIVYLGTSRGEIIKSSDKGGSWKTLQRFASSVHKVSLSPFDSRIIFAVTAKNGVWRTFNSGSDWTGMEEKLADLESNVDFQDIEQPTSKKGLVFLATNYGMLKSENYGDTWSRVELITPEEDSVINDMAVSPLNANAIYYVTNTTFYRSLDGGENWTTKKLPTTRAGWKLIIGPENDNIIYLAVREIKD